MINIQELRIGNKLMYAGKPCSVNAIYLSHFTVYDSNNIQRNSAQDNIERLPLTHEILEMAGFVKTIYTNHKNNPHIPENIKAIDFFDYRKGNMVLSGVGRPIDFFEVEYCALDIEERTYIGKLFFLHQLQNLTYALTGQELSIKEPSKTIPA